MADGNAMNNMSDSAFKFLGSGTLVIYSPGNNTVGYNNGIVGGETLNSPCCAH